MPLENKPLWVKVLAVFVFICAASGCGLAAVGLVAFLSSCANKEVVAVQTGYTVEEGAHSAELSKCLVDAKKDGGMEYFCVCWNLKNAKYHVDAGVECKGQ